MRLKGKPKAISALNIPCYHGGSLDPWRTAEGKVGLLNPYKKNADKGYNDSKKIEKQLGMQKQEITDGLLEFVTFPNLFKMT